jgi:hypothetical protein
MYQRIFPWFLLLLASILAVAHRSAIAFQWYWHYWWFDIAMHFLGGFLIAGVLLLLSPSLQWLARKSNGVFSTGFLIVLGTLIVGLAWELYEYYLGVTFIEFRQYAFDTALDIIMDLAGAIMMVVLHKNPCNRNRG